VITRNSSGDEIPECDVLFIYDDIVHVVQNTKKEKRKQTVKKLLNSPR